MYTSKSKYSKNDLNKSFNKYAKKKKKKKKKILPQMKLT